MKLLGRELTTDEIIRFVRDFAAQTRRYKDCRDCLYIDMALALADEVENNRRTAPENKPLTLEQLREMEDESFEVKPIKPKKWHVYSKSISTSCFETYNYEDYGKTWLAYARRPESTP